MGIPTLFKWLSSKYPKIITNVIEELPQEIDGNSIPVDSSLPNPNGVEIDNLYLDMNGIIHPCCHPEDKPAPNTKEEMYIEIFKYIDRIFGMIRPRKVLYMAIDGVAPRAKMNQQRSRRFRAAQEEEIKRKDEEHIRREWEINHGQNYPMEKDEKKHFDSNCITPGTPFMDKLAICLRYYVTDRLNNDPGWANVKVILSDASVPGEGEHKIMDFIRRQRNQGMYDPNTKHVLYGLDADLIMLALATHEPYFYILREDVFAKANQRACTICGQSDHVANQCQGKAKEKLGQWDDQSKYFDLKPFVFVHISVLREYLNVEMIIHDAPFDWDLERAIDDWVFMCFFVGNDFLPHLPSLEIREGAVELLVDIWKTKAKNWGGYLTDSGDIYLERAQEVLEELGKIEDEVFRNRREGEERRRIQRFERKQENKKRGLQPKQEKRRYGAPPSTAVKLSKLAMMEQMNQLESLPVKGVSKEERHRLNSEAVQSRYPAKPKQFSHKNPSSTESNMHAAKKLKMALLAKKVDANPTGGLSMVDFMKKDEEEEEVIEESVAVPVEAVEDEIEETVEQGSVESATEIEEDPETGLPIIIKEDVDSDAEPPADDIRLWESGWKIRYYKNKFQVDVQDENFRQEIVKSYVEGLCWVLKYYYQGVQSWKWYYPYHYSPFASDFTSIGDLKIEFEKSQPFKPIEQLMGVFPAASKDHIPKPFHYLMTDPDSEIIDFYPTEFPIDLNGKKYLWQGVALLPFIDADRLLKAVEPLYSQITPEEQRRNTLGNEYLFCGGSHPMYDDLCSIYGNKANTETPLDKSKSDRMGGSVRQDPDVCFPGCTYHSPLSEFGMPDIENKSSISAFYFMPEIPKGYKFIAKLLKGVKMPLQLLTPDDHYAIRAGYSASDRGRRGGRGRFGNAANRMFRNGLALKPENSRSDNRGYNNGRGNEDRQDRYSNDRNDYRNNRNDDNRGGRGNRYEGNDQYSRNDYRNSDSSRYDRNDNYNGRDSRNYRNDQYDRNRSDYSRGGQYRDDNRYNSSRDNNYSRGGYDRDRGYTRKRDRNERETTYQQDNRRGYTQQVICNLIKNTGGYQPQYQPNLYFQPPAYQAPQPPVANQDGAALVANLLNQLGGANTGPNYNQFNQYNQYQPRPPQ
ncbi:5'-3' exoribonuclease 2 [Boothiomyces sp. JEL0838]|nr:5'-3' exoribonuclease 2 [Boothiomyces sp. JEL0838]